MPRCLLALLLPLLVAGCRTALLSEVVTVPASGTSTSFEPEARPVVALGDGAAPGGEDGPGGFVPRGTRRNFYAGAGGRLWYYLNNYYWVSETAPLEDLWIRAEVEARFTGLRRWPDGAEAPSPPPKVTVEYWAVGAGRRSVRLDNHKDYCLLDDHYCAGRIEVQVTLTLGHLAVRDERGSWGGADAAYVLESRNYADRDGIGAERVRFAPLATEAVTVWGYRIPWSTHPQRLTRSNWARLEPPDWELLARRPPPDEVARPAGDP